MKLRILKKSERECGECSACCTTCPIEELAKPGQVPCRHLATPSGCSIYPDRPKSCRDFVCLWLQGFLPEQYRPDQCGIVWSDSMRAGHVLLHARLTKSEVPLETIKYHIDRIRKSSRYPIVTYIWPIEIKPTADEMYHFTQLAPEIWIADRKSTEGEIFEIAKVDQTPNVGLKSH